MDYTEHVSFTIATGVMVGLYYTRRTGWTTGGLVTPGLIALQAANPVSFFGVLLLALGFAAILRPIVKCFSLYGRERVGAALLMAILFRFFFRGSAGMDVFWLGWVAPGLIAADIERQGAAMTLAASATAGIVTAMIVLIATIFAGHVYAW